MRFISILFVFLFLGVNLSPRIEYSESKYTEVSATDVDTTGGVVIPNGETVALYRAMLDGADPLSPVSVVYCYGDPTDEKIFLTTTGSVDRVYDVSLSMNQVTGDGVCKIKVILKNNDTDAVTIGGSFEVLKL